MAHVLHIGDNDVGQRLDSFVTKTVPLLPSSLVQKFIRMKKIKVNGKRAEGAYRLQAGDELQLYISDAFLVKPSEEEAFRYVRPEVRVVYEDENILLADKRPGLLVHADDRESRNTLVAHIQAYLYERGEWDPARENSFAPALCNRIDRNTGGIVIAAKNAPALRVLNEKIRQREVRKFYQCIVHGRMKPPTGRLDSVLVRDMDEKRVYTQKTRTEDGRSASTLYRTLAVRGQLSLLECELLTGRTHQIRAQFAQAGHPLLGDGKYGKNEQNRSYAMRYQALYACRVMFAFETDAGVLSYLHGKSFAVDQVDFAEAFLAGRPL